MSTKICSRCLQQLFSGHFGHSATSSRSSFASNPSESSPILFEQLTPEDIPIIDGVTSTASRTYVYGQRIWQLKYDTCPDYFVKIVVSQSDERSNSPESSLASKSHNKHPSSTFPRSIVGISVMHPINSELAWGHLVALRPEFRSKGVLAEVFERIGIVDWNTIGDWRLDIPWAHLKNMGDSVTQWERHGYGGKVTIDPKRKIDQKSNSHLVTLNTSLPSEADSQMAQSLIREYDAGLYAGIGAPRREKFMQQWCLDKEDSICAVALDSGDKIVGYGVARRGADRDWRLSPVYADDPDTAFDLILHLGRRIPTHHAFVYACFPAFAQSAASACEALGLAKIDASRRIRVCSRRVVELPYEKMYGKAEFWPM